MHLKYFNCFSVRIVEFVAAMLTSFVQFAREKNVLPRGARLPVKWAVVLQQTFLWRLKVSALFF